jgi:hypothetical protein
MTSTNRTNTKRQRKSKKKKKKKKKKKPSENWPNGWYPKREFVSNTEMEKGWRLALRSFGVGNNNVAKKTYP